MKRVQPLILLLISWSLLYSSCSKDDSKDQEPSPLPVVTTHPVTSIKSDSALFSGTVVSEGQSAVVQRGFCWSTSPNPTVSDSFSDNAFGSGIFSHQAAGLISNTSYFVRAYAMNGFGTAYGNQVVFKTTFKIGDPGPAGGIVFYLDGSGGGLEVAPESTEAMAEWGCLNSFLTGTSISLGSGQSNTDTITTKCPAIGIAAQVCDVLVHNGYSDWYLPSKDELNLIYLNLAVPGLASFTGYRYWTSSEASASSAWRQDLTPGLGAQATNTKTNAYLVRAIRSF